MRMWMTDPRGMCRQHLLGEHNECHMLLGAMAALKRLDGFKGLVEPFALRERHFDLALEMRRRGYNHKSPLEHGAYATALEARPNYYRGFPLIDRDAALTELHRRCSQCRTRAGS